MKNILLITEYFYPEEFGINDLIPKFKSSGYKVHVLTQTPSYPYDKPYNGYKNRLFQIEEKEGVIIYRVFSLLWRKKSFLPKTLAYLFFALISSVTILFIKRKKFDSVFVYQVGPLTQIIPALFSKLIFKNKISIWILDLWPFTVWGFGLKKNLVLEFLLNTFCKIAYKYSDNILVSNEGFIEKINFYVPNKKIHFIPQWIPNDINYLYNDYEFKFKPLDINFLFAGNVGKVQNLENIITAFSSCPEKYVLHVVGDGSNLSKLKALSKGLNCENVIFYGRVPFSEISNWLLSADVLIISLIDKLSFNLTVPAKFQAYLGAFKPILGVINGETAKLINKNQLGLTAHPDNIIEIKEQINKFKKENAFFNKKASEILLNESYNFEKIVVKIIKILEK